ncbi:hypothetical protein GCM10009765_65090 [Fodinicola feengrottensis]|uniref:Uncharacterized protein n=1 Tax=Fodinicola feengrottensis TaxID=435914 RepID=A0ABN2IK62_9ACTN
MFVTDTPKLRVRGACPKCKRIVSHFAPKGRTTWRGPCPKPDCGGIVFARRIPDSEAATAPTATPDGDPPTETPKPTGTPRKKIVKVQAYERAVRPGAELDPNVQPTPPPGSPDPGADAGKPRPEQPTAGGPDPKPGPPVKADRPEVESHDVYGRYGY